MRVPLAHPHRALRPLGDANCDLPAILGLGLSPCHHSSPSPCPYSQGPRFQGLASLASRPKSCAGKWPRASSWPKPLDSTQWTWRKRVLRPWLARGFLLRGHSTLQLSLPALRPQGNMGPQSCLTTGAWAHCNRCREELPDVLGHARGQTPRGRHLTRSSSRTLGSGSHRCGWEPTRPCGIAWGVECALLTCPPASIRQRTLVRAYICSPTALAGLVHLGASGRL